MPSVLAALAALASAASGAQELWASAAPVKLVPAMMPWPFFDAEIGVFHIADSVNL